MIAHTEYIGMKSSGSTQTGYSLGSGYSSGSQTYRDSYSQASNQAGGSLASNNYFAYNRRVLWDTR